MNVPGKVFIVTGASSGIGLSTARLLSSHGAKVALLARRTSLINDLAKEIPNSAAFTVDMTDFDAVRKSIRQVFDHFGQIDGLINNAGRSYGAAIEEIQPEAFDEIFHLNVLGPIVAMQAVIPIMRAQKAGAIVNINSGTAFMTVPQFGVYSSSKRALLGFSLTARIELEPDGIVVSEVYPTVTDTNFGVNRMVNAPGGGPSTNYSAGDSPESVAEIVLTAIQEGGAQYFANENLRQLAGVQV